MTSRTKRIARDFHEIVARPISRIGVSIQEDDIGKNSFYVAWIFLTNEFTGVWHCNIEGSQFDGVLAHFQLRFPPAYPQQPPRIVFATYLEHINNLQVVDGYEVCLDMLQLPSDPNAPSTPFVYWSPILTAYSVLMQISSFVLCESTPTPTALINRSRIIQEALSFQCSCGHTHNSPIPTIACEEAVNHALTSFPPVDVNGAQVDAIRSRRLARNKIAQSIYKQVLTLEIIISPCWCFHIGRGRERKISTSSCCVCCNELWDFLGYSCQEK